MFCYFKTEHSAYTELNCVVPPNNRVKLLQYKKEQHLYSGRPALSLPDTRLTLLLFLFYDFKFFVGCVYFGLCFLLYTAILFIFLLDFIIVKRLARFSSKWHCTFSFVTSFSFVCSSVFVLVYEQSRYCCVFFLLIF